MGTGTGNWVDNNLYKERVQAEMAMWDQNHPFGFHLVLKGLMKDGNKNVIVAEGAIPGPDNTELAGAAIPIQFKIPPEYPHKLPECKFEKDFVHPNVSPNGRISLPKDWFPNSQDVTLVNIMLDIQELLREVHDGSVANSQALWLYKDNKTEYSSKMKKYKEKRQQRGLLTPRIGVNEGAYLRTLRLSCEKRRNQKKQ
eukprot:m.340040 g.340040  ORF g.340040 m.340040 type:complete len:198 (+) comp19095_c0_seq1:72-665(+)